MSAQYKTSWNVYSAWNYEKEIEDLNRASEQGWQLVKGGCFHSRFVKRPEIRYRYQLDFQKPDDLGRYIEIFREQGWEYINSTFNGWNYFRKIYDPSRPEESYEIFTDRESLREMNGRWVKIAAALAVFIGIMTLTAGFRLIRRPCLPYLVQMLTFLLECVFLLRGAFIMNDQDRDRSRSGENTLLLAFFAALVIGCFSFTAMESARPRMQTLMQAESVSEPVKDDRFNDFRVLYPDFYYLDLKGESAEPMTLEILDQAGEAVFSRTGTEIGGERIRLKLSRGQYVFSLSCTSGFKLDIDLK